MKIGVILDGISRDMETALKIMEKEGIKYTQLQFVWEKEIGDHTKQEVKEMKRLLNDYGVTVTCITKHNFSGISVLDTKVGDQVYEKNINKLKRSIEVAHELGTKNVRVMGFSKQVIIWGENGAEQWVANQNQAWDCLLELYRKPLEIAQEEDIYLVSETGNNSMITSGYLHKKLIDDLGSERMKTLWDPANSIVGGDIPYPNGYEYIKNSLVDVHIKDLIAIPEKGIVQFCQLGTGQMGPYLPQIAKRLKEDQFDGVVTLENVFRPNGKEFIDGFYQNISCFKQLFE